AAIDASRSVASVIHRVDEERTWPFDEHSWINRIFGVRGRDVPLLIRHDRDPNLGEIEISRAPQWYVDGIASRWPYARMRVRSIQRAGWPQLERALSALTLGGHHDKRVLAGHDVPAGRRLRNRDAGRWRDHTLNRNNMTSPSCTMYSF